MTWKSLRERVGVVRILEEFGVIGRFRRVGARLVGPCPVHRGDNPGAFTVDPSGRLWHCFTRCSGGGDAIALAFRLCDSSWPRTAEWLRRIAGTTPSEVPHPRPLPIPTLPPPREFRPFPYALDLDVTHPFFAGMGLEPATLRHFEAGAWHGRGFLAGTVAVRLHDIEGHPLGYAGRRLVPDEVRRFGKWKFPPGLLKGRLLFGWHRVEPTIAHGLIVVESPWSVMKFWQAGVKGVVALCGVSVSEAQRKRLSTAPRLLLVLDGDEAGDLSTRRLQARPFHPAVTIARPPQGTDPADLDEETLRGLLPRSWLD